MTQTRNPILDELAKVVTDAAGAAQGLRREAGSVMRSQAERLLRDLDVAPREEVEAVKAMAAKALSECERLGQRLARLEALAGVEPDKA